MRRLAGVVLVLAACAVAACSSGGSGGGQTVDIASTNTECRGGGCVACAQRGGNCAGEQGCCAGAGSCVGHACGEGRNIVEHSLGVRCEANIDVEPRQLRAQSGVKRAISGFRFQ